MFLELIDPAATQFAELRMVTETAAQGLNEQTAAQLMTLGTSVEAGLTNLMTTIEEGLTVVVDGLDTALSDVTSAVNRTFTTSLEELRTGLGQTIQDADSKVVSTIGEGVAQADQALGEMNGKMSEAAEEAGWRYDHPVLATLKDIGGFVAGLVVGIVVVVALAVVVIAAANLLIAGLVALGLSSLVATLIVAVVGIGALAFGIYQAYQARVASGEAGGWGTLGMALLDTTGLTTIYHGIADPTLNPFERGLTIGTGGATAGTLIFGNRLNAFVRTRLLDGLAGRLVLQSNTAIVRANAQAEAGTAGEVGGLLREQGLPRRLSEAWLDHRDIRYLTPELEAKYQNYTVRKQRLGANIRERDDWFDARNEFWGDGPAARGNNFNKTANQNYTYSEIHLANGKRVDAYIPGREIISRKAVDFDRMSEADLLSFIREMKTKYAPGTVIRTNKHEILDGQQLSGQLMLEVPDTNINAANRARFEAIANSEGVGIKYTPE